MKAEDCFGLGILTKPHGVSGALNALLDTNSPEHYQDLQSVFIEINKKLVPFFIESISIRNKKAILRFEEIESLAQAADLSGKKLFLPLDLLPASEGNDFYYHDIVGFSVLDKKLGSLGTIVGIVENPGHDLLVMEYQGDEVLIPVTDTIVLNADLKKSILYTDLPDGLIDLNLRTPGKEQDED